MYIVLLSLYSTGGGQLAIREACIDIGLPPNCSDDKAIKAASELSLVNAIIPGTISIIMIGFMGAVGNRLGRKYLLLLASLGTFSLTLPFTLIYWIPSIFRPHWKMFIVGGNVLNSLAGGILIAYLGVFGAISDVSAKKPSMRMLLYICIDIAAGLCGIIAAQVAARLMHLQPTYLTTTCSAGFAALALYILVFFNETIDPKSQQAPINWKKANTLGQLSFILPIHSSLKTLNKDFNQIYLKLVDLYNTQDGQENERITTLTPHIGENNVIFSFQQNPNEIQQDLFSLDPATNSDLQHRHGFQRNTISSTSSAFSIINHDPHESLNLDLATEGAVLGVPAQYDDIQNVNGITRTMFHDSPILSPSRGDFLDDDKIGLTKRATQSSRSPLGGLSEKLLDDMYGADSEETPKFQEITPIEEETPDSVNIPKLKLSGPPRYIEHGNAMFMLVITIFLYVCSLFGSKVIDLFYVKKVYHVTTQGYSNLLTIAAVTRGVGSFVLVPLLKKFIKTPNHERLLLVFSMIGIGVSNLLVCFCQQSYTLFCLLSVANGLFSTLPSGLVRSLMSNAVTESLQGSVLSSIAAAEVWVFVVGGLCFNLIWLQTSAYPYMSYIVISGLAFLGALFPLFITDSVEDFNMRIEMTTQYTKITLAEKKYKDQQEKLNQQISLPLANIESNNREFLLDDSIAQDAV